MYEVATNGGDTLILLPCSGRRDNNSTIAAEAYGSMVANCFNQAVKDGRYKESMDTYFVSGKHGLIPPEHNIGEYDDELAEEGKKWLMNQIGDFLDESDYSVMFSFLDGMYQKVVNEVAYNQQTNWEIDTALIRPCGRAASMGGVRVLKQLNREEVDVASAAATDW